MISQRECFALRLLWQPDIDLDALLIHGNSVGQYGAIAKPYVSTIPRRPSISFAIAISTPDCANSAAMASRAA